MRIKVVLQNYNTIHTKYQELLSAMLKEQRGERMDEEFIRNRITELRLQKRRFRISDEHGVRAEQKLYSGDFFRAFYAVYEAVSQHL